VQCTARMARATVKSDSSGAADVGKRGGDKDDRSREAQTADTDTDD
jgi:hypothetical protein